MDIPKVIQAENYLVAAIADHHRHELIFHQPAHQGNYFMTTSKKNGVVA